LKVAEVAGKEISHDVAFPVRKQLVATGEAVHHQKDIRRLVALANEIGPGRNVADLGHKLVKQSKVAAR